MATLKSVDTEDLQLVLEICMIIPQSPEPWVEYKIEYHTGTFNIKLWRDNLPQDRCSGFKKLLDGINSIIKGQKDSIEYEAIEPDYEIKIVFNKPTEANPEGYYLVTLWRDLGNLEEGVYGLDALGLRLVTDKKNLIKFYTQLKKELD
ncbi:MAG: hypothetical protein MSIBF_00880 [Candidatus Altiarchaeales archaeon IMC4]|nr:MAG: hypothetical protein MSIBF_00880 [Candidatus Altiarchaeales archaeon IMC4]